MLDGDLPLSLSFSNTAWLMRTSRRRPTTSSCCSRRWIGPSALTSVHKRFRCGCSVVHYRNFARGSRSPFSHRTVAQNRGSFRTCRRCGSRNIHIQIEFSGSKTVYYKAPHAACSDPGVTPCEYLKKAFSSSNASFFRHPSRTRGALARNKLAGHDPSHLCGVKRLAAKSTAAARALLL